LPYEDSLEILKGLGFDGIDTFFKKPFSFQFGMITDKRGEDPIVAYPSPST
jgi:hypothetical protein